MRNTVFLAALLLPAALAAQSTQPDLETRLLHKPLYLRGLWAKDKLHFDATGRLEGNAATVSFTESGIDVTGINLTPHKLTIEGIRVGLTFDKTGSEKRVPMILPKTFDHPKNEQVQIEIEAPAGGDYSVPLEVIFAPDLASLVPTMPAEWQPFALKHFLGQPAEPAATPRSPATSDLKRIGGAVTPPRVLFAPEPTFSQPARNNRIPGNVLVYLQVDRDGRPQKLKLLRPVGMGLDERAVAAVALYKFSPAMENGQPVPVEMNVEVNFQIF